MTLRTSRSPHSPLLGSSHSCSASYIHPRGIRRRRDADCCGSLTLSSARSWYGATHESEVRASSHPLATSSLRDSARGRGRTNADHCATPQWPRTPPATSEHGSWLCPFGAWTLEAGRMPPSPRSRTSRRPCSRRCSTRPCSPTTVEVRAFAPVYANRTPRGIPGLTSSAAVTPASADFLAARLAQEQYGQGLPTADRTASASTEKVVEGTLERV